MVQALLFGVVQGVAEWLPVSSEGLVVLLGVRFLEGSSVADLIRLALFLHLGTFAAALVYFRRDVLVLLYSLVRYRSALPEERSYLRFFVIATIVTGIVGGILFKTIINVEYVLRVSEGAISGIIGVLLLMTAFILLLKKKSSARNEGSLTATDALVVGVLQGFAALPGLSRSGLTVSALLLRGVDDEAALRTSFLMSLPAVLGANIILNFSSFTFSSALLIALVASFLFGLLTIHILLAFARRVNMGVFVLLFALLMIGSLLV